MATQAGLENFYKCLFCCVTVLGRICTTKFAILSSITISKKIPLQKLQNQIAPSISKVAWYFISLFRCEPEWDLYPVYIVHRCLFEHLIEQENS